MFQFVAIQPTYLPGTPFQVSQQVQEALDPHWNRVPIIDPPAPVFDPPSLFTMHPNLQAQPGLTPTPRQAQHDSQQTQKIFRLAEENHGNNMNNSFEMFRKVQDFFWGLYHKFVQHSSLSKCPEL